MSSIWTTHNEYVDIETGEQIRKQCIDNEDYKIVKKLKKTIVNNETGKRTIKVTNECRRNKYKQLTIDFNRTY